MTKEPKSEKITNIKVEESKQTNSNGLSNEKITESKTGFRSPTPPTSVQNTQVHTADGAVDLAKFAADPRLLDIQKGQSTIHRHVADNKLIAKIPDWKLKKASFDSSCVQISGPYSKQVPPSTFSHAYAQTISTYPQFVGKASREGDPICDSYRVHVHRCGTILCVSDGCGWGERSKRASNRSKDTFVTYFEENFKSAKSTLEIAEHLVNAVAYANYSIYYDAPKATACGTTTLLGGVILESSEIQVNFKNSSWVFIGITIGDCKCFKYSTETKECIDITAGNRMNIVDPRDPGGRLGAHQKSGDPDLRNLDFVFTPLAEGDILIVASDGVHDNLDPQVQGKSPKQFGVEAKDWEEVDVAQGTKIKTDFMNKFLTNLICKDSLEINPAIITKKLIKHCRDLTSVSRQWMEQNQDQVLGVNYEKFPGKLVLNVQIQLNFAL